MINSPRKHPTKQTQQPNTDSTPEPEEPVRTATPQTLSATRDRLRRRAISELRDDFEDFCRSGHLSEVFLLTEALRMSATDRGIKATDDECPIADAMAILSWG